jgi:hypothetical protein
MRKDTRTPSHMNKRQTHIIMIMTMLIITTCTCTDSEKTTDDKMLTSCGKLLKLAPMTSPF